MSLRTIVNSAITKNIEPNIIVELQEFSVSKRFSKGYKKRWLVWNFHEKFEDDMVK